MQKRSRRFIPSMYQHLMDSLPFTVTFVRSLKRTSRGESSIGKSLNWAVTLRTRRKREAFFALLCIHLHRRYGQSILKYGHHLVISYNDRMMIEKHFYFCMHSVDYCDHRWLFARWVPHLTSYHQKLFARLKTWPMPSSAWNLLRVIFSTSKIQLDFNLNWSN